MSTNPGPTTTYRHNICGNMAERHDSGPGIIRCGDVPQDISTYRELDKIYQALNPPHKAQLISFLALLASSSDEQEKEAYLDQLLKEI